MASIHKTLAGGRWQSLSLAEQLGNIGGEVSRAVNWKGKDEKLYQGALDRALELIDLTIADQRWRKRLKELLRVRELLVDAAEGGQRFKTSFQDLARYFLYFAVYARITK